MAATSMNRKVDEDEIKEALSTIKTLQAYRCGEGLQLLKDNGFRLATLTNSPPLALKQQLINSNLTDYFEQALSIDSLKNTNQPQKLFMGRKELTVKPRKC
jgi:2-haloacid dehalogenase